MSNALITLAMGLTVLSLAMNDQGLVSFDRIWTSGLHIYNNAVELSTPAWNFCTETFVYRITAHWIQTAGGVFSNYVWFPVAFTCRIITDLALGVREYYHDFACHNMPEEWWRAGAFPEMDCERRLYPWTVWLREEIYPRLLVPLVIAVLSLPLSAFFAWRLARTTRDSLFVNSRFRLLRLLTLWCDGDVLASQWFFKPRTLGGTKTGISWSTSRRGLTVVRDNTITTYEYLPVCTGRFWIGCLPFELAAQRRGDKVRYSVQATWWAWERLPEDFLTDNLCLRAERHAATLNYYLANSGETTCVTVGGVLWDTIMAALSAAGKDTQSYAIGTIIARFFKDMPRDKLTTYQSLIANYWNTHRRNNCRLQWSGPNQTLQFLGDVRDVIDTAFKCTGRRIMPCFVTKEDTMPVSGAQNSNAAVQMRLDDKRNPATIDQVVLDYASEFINQLNLEPIVPWDLEDIIEHQDGPLQKIRNALAKWNMFVDACMAPVKAMIKKEAVANNGAVRNISTLEAEFNLALGRYMMPAAAWFKKNTTWYCAGKTPAEVANRMEELARNAPIIDGVRRVCANDVSKMDAGKHGLLTAHLTSAIYFRMFGACDELVALRKAEVSGPARTAEGDSYKIGGSQLSGSASTTIDNTLTSAFISYVAGRCVGKTPEQAYTDLGAYVGDDAVSYDAPEGIAKASSLLGYSLTPEMIDEYEPIPFLSRTFYSAWVGGTESIQDPVRLMRKIALSTAPSKFTDQQAAVNKLRGYSELDPNCTVYTSLYDNIRRITCLEANAREEGYMQAWARESGGWPTASSADAYWEKATGLSPKIITDWADALESWEEFMEGPPCLILTDAPDKVQLSVDPTCVSSVVPAEAGEGPIPPTATVALPPETTTPAVEDCERREREAKVAIDRAAAMAACEKVITRNTRPRLTWQRGQTAARRPTKRPATGESRTTTSPAPSVSL